MMIIDCSSVSSIEEFWNLYVDQDAIEGKAHFGRNLDALGDALTGGGPGYPGDIDRIRLVGSKHLMLIDGGSFYEKLVRLSKDLEDCSYSRGNILLD